MTGGTDPWRDSPHYRATGLSPDASLRPETLAPRRAPCSSMSTTMLTLAISDGEPSRMWLDGVRNALLMLRTDLHGHRAATGGPLGTHHRILATAPRLSKAIADLDREQEDIARLLDRVLTGVAGTASTHHVDRVRVDALALIRRLTRYQQHDADLLHEADQVDVGGQG